MKKGYRFKMSEILKTYPALTSLVDSGKSVIVIVLAANRTNEAGEVVALTPAQKDAALNGAKSVLEVVGAEVVGNASSLLIPSGDVGEDENRRLTIKVELEKVSSNE